MDHQDDVEYLDRALDRFAHRPEGVSFDERVNGASPAETQAAATFLALDAVDRDADPRPGFLAALERQLLIESQEVAAMTTTSVTGASRTLDGSPVFGTPRQTVDPPNRHSRPYRIAAARPVRWLATAGLLAVIVVLGAISFRGMSGNGDPQPTAFGFAQSSPSPAARQDCNSDAYVGCPGATTLLAASTSELNNVDPVSLDVRQVQLQNWIVPPGAAVPGTSIDGDTLRGLVIEFVITGAYSATFDVPVTAFRQQETNVVSVEQIPAGNVVELGRGDSVAYKFGGLTELRNPLQTRATHFKRAVFYEGDVSVTHAAASAEMTVDGDGTLPNALGAFTPGNKGIGLWYVQVPPGATFPPSQWQNNAVVGPVDPNETIHGSDIVAGYVLTVGNPTG